MINWRSITKHGLPTDHNIGYMVFDGKFIEFSDIEKDGTWTGGSSYATYEEVSETVFDFAVTHWCPVNEIQTPDGSKYPVGF